MVEVNGCDYMKSIDQMSYENEDYKTSFLESMKAMYDLGELTDVKISAQNSEISCHRNVLAASSPYFRAMFTTSLTESKQDKIHIYELDAESLGLIVEYAYTGRVEITRNNAQNLLAAASLFQITSIHEACARFMQTQLDIHNCVGISCFAQIHNCDQLHVTAREYIEKHFTEVCGLEEFMLLDHERVTELISSNELNVEKEEVVFEAMMSWLKYDLNKRISHIAELLPHIRFALLPPRYFHENVVSNCLFLNSHLCKDILRDLKSFEANPDTYEGEHLFNTVLRSGMIKPEHCILLVGGVDQQRPSTNCYNALTREAYFVAGLSDSTRVGYYDIEDPACVVTEDNQIFMAGGNYIFHEHYAEATSDEDSLDEYDGEETIHKELYLYDNDHNTWMTKAPMLFPKSNFTMAYMEGKIYCFGGLTVNQHPTEIVECYDILHNRWSYAGMMPTTLVDLVSVTHESNIYILGGRTGVGAHNVVLKYDPHNLEWVSLAGMPTPRFNFGACVVGNEIYVAGGQIYSHAHQVHFVNRENLNSVEIYNIQNNQWRQGPSLPEGMYSVGLFLINGSLYACGTTEYHRTAFRVYRYNVVYKLDFVQSQWETLETDLCDIRNFACVSAKLHTRKLSRVFRPEVDT